MNTNGSETHSVTYRKGLQPGAECDNVTAITIRNTEGKLSTHNCWACGAEFIKSSKAQRYCSLLCASIKGKEARDKAIKTYRLSIGVKVGVGKGGNNAKGALDSSYTTGIKNFRKIKLQSMKEWLCERCEIDLTSYIAMGGKNSMWIVHHKDADRENNEQSNAELLCKRCHQLHHNCVDNLKV